MIIDTFAKVKWHISNRQRYEDLGYNFTKYRDEFTVPIEHLHDGSKAEVLVACNYDGCKNKMRIPYNRLINTLAFDKYGLGGYLCSECWDHEFGHISKRTTEAYRNKKIKELADYNFELRRDDLIMNVNIPTVIAAIPRNKRGIYKFYDKDFNLLYIGKACDVKGRVSNHLSHISNTKSYSEEFGYVAVTFVDYKTELKKFEAYLINTLKPKYNERSVYTYSAV